MHFATPRSLIHDLSAPTPSSNRFIKNRKHFIRGKGTDMSVIVASFVVESLTKYFVLVSPVGHTKLNCQIQKWEEIEESNVNWAVLTTIDNHGLDKSKLQKNEIYQNYCQLKETSKYHNLSLVNQPLTSVASNLNAAVKLNSLVNQIAQINRWADSAESRIVNIGLPY